MTLLDLLFLALALAGIVTAVVALVAALRGRRARARALMRQMAIVAALYFGTLILVSAFTPQQVLAAGEDDCSDDWCIAVMSARRDSTPAGTLYDVAFRLSSRAGRVSQREQSVAAHLRDSVGRDYAAVPVAGEVPFDTLLHPREVITATRRFVVPAGTPVAGVVITREGGGRFPGCCIIGDNQSFFHRRTIAKFD